MLVGGIFYIFPLFYGSSEEVEELAKRLKLRLFRTSVKEDFNINEG